MTIHIDTEQASAPKSQDAVEIAATDSHVVARLIVGISSESEVTFLKYSDGDVMIKQNDDRVYLTAAQFESLKKFMETA